MSEPTLSQFVKQVGGVLVFIATCILLAKVLAPGKEAIAAIIACTIALGYGGYKHHKNKQ